MTTGIDRRLKWAIVASLLVHLCLVLGVRWPQLEPHADRSARALAITLMPSIRTVVEPAPDEIEIAPVPIETSTHDLPSAPARAEPARTPASATAPHPRLNLSLPKEYQQPPAVQSDPTVVDPEFAAAIRAAQGDSRRPRVPAARERQRDGVDAQTYARDTGGRASREVGGQVVRATRGTDARQRASVAANAVHRDAPPGMGAGGS